MTNVAKNRTIYISPAYESIWGRTCTSLYASPHQWSESVHPEDRERILQASLTQQVLSTYDEEYRILTPDGVVRWIHERAFPVKNEAGEVYRIAGVAQDITERKRTQENILKLNAELEQRVTERTRELTHVNAKLDQASRLKDEFLANMSHELRTPLNAILGLSESLLEQIGGTLTPRQLKSVSTISASGAHLLALINDILDLSKIDAGKIELRREPVNVEESCRTSLAFVQAQAMKKHVNVAFETDGRVANFEADPRRLKQILVNLLTNAVKFTRSRGRIRFDQNSSRWCSASRFSPSSVLRARSCITVNRASCGSRASEPSNSAPARASKSAA
jgi:PAS domain S-box-containing protein